METETKEKQAISKAFQLFVGGDNGREVLMRPFEINDFVYATDSYALIRTLKKNYKEEIVNHTQPPSADKVIPEGNMYIPLNIKKQEFEKYKDTDEYEPDVGCSACDGEGEVEWEFEHHSMSADCPECNGSGLMRPKVSRKTGNKVFGQYLVKIKESYFRIDLFHKLLEVQELIGGDIVLISQSKPQAASLFLVGCCEVLIMPVDYQNEDVGEVWDGVIDVV